MNKEEGGWGWGADRTGGGGWRRCGRTPSCRWAALRASGSAFRFTHPHTNTHTLAHTLTHTHLHTNTCKHTHTHTHKQIRTHTNTRTHTHTDTHTHKTKKHIHTHKNAYTHTQKKALRFAEGGVSVEEESREDIDHTPEKEGVELARRKWRWNCISHHVSMN